MVRSPVEPSPFDKIIKAASTVSTRTGLAALYLVLGFLAFVFVLFLTTGRDRMILAVMIFAVLTVFAVFAVLATHRGGGEGDTREPAEKAKKRTKRAADSTE